MKASGAPATMIVSSRVLAACTSNEAVAAADSESIAPGNQRSRDRKPPVSFTLSFERSMFVAPPIRLGSAFATTLFVL